MSAFYHDSKNILAPTSFIISLRGTYEKQKQHLIVFLWSMYNFKILQIYVVDSLVDPHNAWKMCVVMLQ